MQALFADLADHFQIARNAHRIGHILVNVLKTDFAFGLAAESLQVLRGKQDFLLTRMAQCQVSLQFHIRARWKDVFTPEVIREYLSLRSQTLTTGRTIEPETKATPKALRQLHTTCFSDQMPTLGSRGFTWTVASQGRLRAFENRLFHSSQFLAAVTAKLMDGISEAEASYTRRMTAAKMQGRSLEDVEEIHARKTANEATKRIQVMSTQGRGKRFAVEEGAWS